MATRVMDNLIPERRVVQPADEIDEGRGCPRAGLERLQCLGVRHGFVLLRAVRSAQR